MAEGLQRRRLLGVWPRTPAAWHAQAIERALDFGDQPGRNAGVAGRRLQLLEDANVGMSDASANPVLQDGDKRALRTYKLRLRDKHASELCRQARAVNFVWNYCNETQKKAALAGRRWLVTASWLR
jgi:hypothetical protein